MKIFNYTIIKTEDYEKEQRNHNNQLERMNRADEVGKLVDKNTVLEERIKKLNKENLDETSELRSKISILEDNVEERTKELKKLEASNNSYKGNNTKLSNKVNELEEENKSLKHELAMAQKFKQLPADRKKSKLVPKLKSSSRTSRLAKKMNS